MSKTGTVTSWRGPFGFVETEDKVAVYVATEDIDGGRLRVGRTVTFDTEEGKEGKLKAVNVSGEAVLAKGVKLTEEEKAEDRKKTEEFREKRAAAAKDEIKPIWERVEKFPASFQVTLFRKFANELGSKIEPKRADPGSKDSKKFTKGEFIAFYGPFEGSAKWKEASGGKAATAQPKKKITKE